MWGKYIGIPWLPKGRTREGCDCWGLVRLIYREEWGIVLPSWSETYEDPLDKEATDRAIRRGARDPEWRPMPAPRPGDVVLLRVGSKVCHCGVHVGTATMIHQWQGTNSSLASLASPMWSQRVVGIYRHREAPCLS